MVVEVIDGDDGDGDEDDDDNDDDDGNGHVSPVQPWVQRRTRLQSRRPPGLVLLILKPLPAEIISYKSTQEHKKIFLGQFQLHHLALLIILKPPPVQIICSFKNKQEHKNIFLGNFKVIITSAVNVEAAIDLLQTSSQASMLC